MERVGQPARSEDSMTTTPIKTRFGPGPLSRIGFFLLGAASFGIVMEGARSGHLLQGLFMLFVLGGLGLILQSFSSAGQKRQQRSRDQLAMEILSALRTGQPHRS